VSKILAGINLGTGIILAITSFGVTYLLLRSRLPGKTGSGSIGVTGRIGKRFHHARVPSISLEVSSGTLNIPISEIDVDSKRKSSVTTVDDDSKKEATK
jgi:hypothetical protein